MTLKELENQYNEQAERRKEKIRQEPSKFKRFWKWVWYLICFPWVWLFYNCRDWRSLVCVIISFALWSASVWIWYVLALCSGWETDFAKWCLGIGSAVWIWWLSPVGSPFILLVTLTSIGIKATFNKIKGRKKREKTRRNNE